MVDRQTVESLDDRARLAPQDLLDEGSSVVSGLREQGDHARAAAWLRAMGVAARSVSTLTESVRLLEDAAAEAGAAGNDLLMAEALLSLSGSLAMVGDNAGAVRRLAEASRLSHGDAMLSARLDFQHGTILARQAMPTEAMPYLSRALDEYRAAGDRARVALTLKNLGNLHTYAGDIDAAAQVLSEAREIYIDLDRALDVAGIEYNLGQLALARGDLPIALELFRRSEDARRELLGPDFEPHVGQAEALLAGGLFTEAMALAQRMRRDLHDRGQGADEAEAALLLAQASLLAGDVVTARAAGSDAVALTGRQQRPGWSAHARFVLLEARYLAGDRTEGMAAEAKEIASQLDEAGQSIPAAGCWLVAGRLDLESGALSEAAESFERIERYRHGGPIELRVQAWLAAALLRRAAGDMRGADAAARAGARTISAFQSALGATDVRVGVAQYGVELNELGMRLALDSRRPRRVWEWMERTRAGAARIRAVVPAMDEQLRRDVAALRRITAELREVEPAKSAALVRRRTVLQEAIRSRARTLSGTGSADMGGSLFKEVRRQLGETPLLEMAIVDGQLWAVVIAERTSLHRLAALRDIEFELSSLRATLRRVAGRGLDDVASQTIAHICGQLNEMLLPGGLDAREVVIVPPAQLHAVPWSMLPELATSAVSVAPSAEQWLNAKQRSGSGEGVLIAAGPGLAHADAEVNDLLSIYPQAAVYASSESDVEAVLQDLDGARVAHIACHGTFQFESPMFSALQLAAGDLIAYDIERLGAAPAVVVLSSCDAGLSAARPGDELMGLTSALLSAGTSSLIASIGLVPDTTATRRFMLALHDKMRCGSSPAVALASAQREVADDPAAALAAASFVCFGS